MNTLLKLLYLLLVSCTVSQFDAPTPIQKGEGHAHPNKGRIGSGGSGNYPAIPPQQVTSDIFEPERIPVDILVVVDVSPSMPPDNTQLYSHILSLVMKFTQYDWQLAIATSIGSDCLRSLVKKSLVSLGLLGYDFTIQTFRHLPSYIKPAAIYEEVMLMATKAIQGKLPLYNALSRCNGTPKNWLRANSMLAIVLVTDEDVDHPYHPPDKRCLNSSCINTFWTALQKIRKPHITSRIYGFLNYGQDRDGRREYGDSANDSPDTGADTNTGYLSWRSPQGEPLFDVHKPLFATNGRIKADDTKIMADDFKRWLRKYYILNGIFKASSSIKATYAGGEVRILTSADYQVDGNILTLNDSVADDVKSLEITY